MDKKLVIYYFIAVLFIVGGAVVLSLFESPKDIPDEAEMINPQSLKAINSADHEPRTLSEINFIGKICVVLLVGYLLRDFYRRMQYNSQIDLKAVLDYFHKIFRFIDWLFKAIYGKTQKNSQADPMAMVGYLGKISRITGDSEYDIFCKSAENWPISDDRIDLDFKRYLRDQTLPYYVNDFVRKYHKNLDKLKKRKKEVEPTSWLDWIKALLVFPGSILFLVFVVIFLLY